MVKHYVILSSSYSKGTRIAMHYIINPKMKVDWITEEIKSIKEKCGENVPISTHFIMTESKTWKSVVEKDAFFDDVYIAKSLDEFICRVSEDRKLKGIDIARYILSKIKCTHLKLEKLVYMCYADYLCETKELLFEDKIYAFRFGPVVQSVYDCYKGIREVLDGKDDINDTFEILPIRSRILFAENGIEKLRIIDATLEKYGELSGTDLVDITHRRDTPWSVTDYTVKFNQIEKSTILERHKYETI